jgi:hypothetical protein
MKKKSLFLFTTFLLGFFLLAGFLSCSQPSSGDSSPVLLSIEVTNPPNKTYYTKNEVFDPGGMILTGYNDNGGSRELAGYTVLPVDTSTAGEKTVTVGFDSLETSFSVFVNEYPLEGIVLVSPPDKTEYARGEDFDPAGLVLEGKYPDGQRPIEGYTHDFDSSVEGTFTVTLTLNGFTAGFEITVDPAALVSIAVSSPPDKTLYSVGEQFLPAGLVISGTYTDGGVKTETEYTFSGTGTGTVGERTVTVTLGRGDKKFTTTFIIVVSDGNLSYITVTRPPNKTLYLWYEDIDLTGLVVKGKFSDIADLLTLTIHSEDISYVKDQPGEQNVTIIFEGQDAFFTVTVKAPKLYFDYGRRISELDPPITSAPERYTYTVSSGRTLVLAPITANVAEGAPFVWKVNGTSQSATGKYFSYTGDGGTSTVTVGLAGLPELEITTYVQTVTPYIRPKTESSKARASTGFEYTPAPGQFVATLGATPATEESVRQGLDNFVQTNTSATWAFSLGGWGGYIVMGFDHSVENSGGYDLSINGNAFGNWSEPGVVWVSQDGNGNGQPDDTWYELKGSETGKNGTVQRYSVTYHTPVGTNGPVWEDNLGNSGKFPDKTYYGNTQGYPFWVPGNSITFTGTLLPYSAAGSSSLWGYVDCVGPQYYRISDAIQQDGSPANLQYIDFVKVHCAVNADAGSFGEISTELGVAYDASIPNPDLLVYGVDAGGGQYSYQFINTSGYDLIVTVGGQDYSLIRNGGQTTVALSSSSTYFAVSGGNITYTKETGKVTFKM